MAYTNSSLVSYTNISPFRNSPRNQSITKVTWHHMAGVMTLAQFDAIVHSPGRDMSANYAIDKDAKVGLFCPESDRSWCSSSSWNDNRSVTIEISNSATGDASGWPISDKVYQKAIELTADICRRNGIKKLTYTGDQNGSLTFHCMFASTACPGPYIKSRAQQICNDVNARLNASTNTSTPTPAPSPSTSTSSVKVGDLVKIASNATYYTGGSIPSWVKEENWYIASLSGDRAVIGQNEAKDRNIQSPINTKFLSVVKTNSSTSYTVNLKSTDILYASAGGNTKGTIGVTGVYTITEEKTVNGIKYGKLKSGAGWVKLSGSTASTDIKKGDKVKVINPIIYGTNNKFTVYVSTYTVLEVSGDRVVISSDGKNVTAAVDKKNLQKV